jgi:hypothetical protein
MAGVLMNFLLKSFSPPRAKEQVTPSDVKIGEEQGESWAEVPESFRGLTIPAGPIPTDQKRRQKVESGG